MTRFPITASSGKARKRWGHEVFVAVFSRVVAQCVRAGLVEGTKIHADSSFVDANASPSGACFKLSVTEVLHPIQNRANNAPPSGPKAFGPSSLTSQYQAGEIGSQARQHLIERSFADASNLHGFKRARWRGLIKQSIQDLLIATVQNLRKLIGAIRNAPESARKPLLRTLSQLYTMLDTLLTPDPSRQRVLAST